ncbi:MAG: F0F1 ATP synthase subunit A [Clostridia bacterium]|nr:F0F1 ATP synthase subunit A [Clostridia bacterium]
MGVDISGAMIFLTVKGFPLQDLVITESQVNSWGIILSLTGLCLYLTHGLMEKAETKRQLAAEWIVEKCGNLVSANMGERYSEYVYFIAAIMGLSAFSSLSCLIGLFAPTGDVNVTAGWAILVFALVTWTKMQGGVLNYLKGFTEPIPVFTPMNFISEFSLPVSMAFRHYGNVMSGAVISVLIGTALRGLSKSLLGAIPVIGNIPLLQVGLPAILSLYFDVFSGLMQAFIFAMLTMLNVSGAFPQEAWEKRQAKKAVRRQRAAAAKAG